MRKFRLNRNLVEIKHIYPSLVNRVSGIFSIDEIPEGLCSTIKSLIADFPNDWEEVFEQETANIVVGRADKKPALHKDTDLGYFVGVLLQAGFNIHTVVADAKELIKQLDNEQIPQ